MATSVNNLSGLNLAQLVELGENFLQQSSDSAKLDAQVLLCFVLEKQPSYLLTWPEKKLNAEQYQQFQQLLVRRKASEPVAYLTGQKEFWSLMFEVSPATLIPRPDTETLIELVLALVEQEKLANGRLLDLGTGTGAIALALASELPNWQVDAVDYSDDAVALAKRNAKRLVLSQVSVYQSDWFKQVPSDKRFDIIVSNPPYIDEDDHHLNQGDVQFEPKSALVAQQNGLADIVEIAASARSQFNSAGHLFLEHGFEQGLAVRQILTELGYQQVKTHQDLSGNDRITSAKFTNDNN
ncbi:peptide chain release factor N(5)-glutamine methyltransferase [Thalassotalea sp. PLHSN55]|uniref:peptide chain release factor N(5)-glutamine methyltransferase n=1 Tax=Thalassotalea sp. PLHSN55 TaxID=3435888 RepID=UPI003F858AD5